VKGYELEAFHPVESPSDQQAHHPSLTLDILTAVQIEDHEIAASFPFEIVYSQSAQRASVGLIIT